MSKFINFKSVFSMLTVVMVLGIFAITTNNVNAKPPGLRASCLGKKLFNYNVIVKPNEWEAFGEACNGARIFMDDDGGSIGRISLVFDSAFNNFSVTDCDGTDELAEVRVDEDVAQVVAIRLLGPVDSTLQLDCTVVTDPTVTPPEDLCIVDGVQNIPRNGAFVRISQNLNDDDLENITYDVDGDFHIFQVWHVEWDGTNCF